MSIYRRTALYYKTYAKQTLAAVLLSIIGVGLNLAKPWPFKFIVDSILPFSKDGSVFIPLNRSGETRYLLSGSATRWILAACFVFLLINVLAGLLTWFANAIFIRIGLQALLKIRTELYACLHALPLKYHDKRRSADSSFRVAYDSMSIQTIYNKGFAGIFNSLLTLLATVAIMVRMDWKLTLLSLAVVPLLIGTLRLFSKRVRDQCMEIM